MYKVLLNNDDYTPMDFVVEVLQKYFSFDEEHTTQVMLNDPSQGKRVFEVFTAEVAETKAEQVNRYAREDE